MSQFDTATPYLDELTRQSRQAATDSIIHAKRAKTPQAVTDQRSVKRLSIQELNEADADAIPNLLEKTRFDNRSTITKILDLVDLDRNTIVNIAAGKPTAEGVAAGLGASLAKGAAGGALVGAGIGAVGGPVTALAGAGIGAAITGGLSAAEMAAAGIARQFTSEASRERLSSGEKAAFGQPRISGIDLLKEMGVDNHILRAVGGLGLDVALDPVSYVGAPGYGVRVGAKVAGAWHEIPLLRSYKKAISAATEAAATGGYEAVRDSHLQTIVKELGHTAESVKASGYDTARKTIASQLRGDLQGKKVARALEVMGEPKRFEGDVLGRFADMPRPDAVDEIRALENSNAVLEGRPVDYERAMSEARIGEAARATFAKHAKGSKSLFRLGLKEGEVGSELYHFPLVPDLSLLSVKAFTPTAELANAIKGYKSFGKQAPGWFAAARATQGVLDGIHAVENLRTEATKTGDIESVTHAADAALANAQKTEKDLREAWDARQKAGDAISSDEASAYAKLHEITKASVEHIRARMTEIDSPTIAKLDEAHGVIETNAARNERFIKDLQGAGVLSRNEVNPDLIASDIAGASHIAEYGLPQVVRTYRDIGEAEGRHALDELVSEMSRGTDTLHRVFDSPTDQAAVRFRDEVDAYIKQRLVGDGRHTISDNPEIRNAVHATVAPHLEKLNAMATDTGIPAMITKGMEADLRAMGVTEKELNAMTPAQAWERIGGRDRAATINTIHELTRPLREGPQVPVEQALADMRAADVAQYDSRLRKWINAPENEMAAMRAAIQPKLDSIAKAKKLADTLNAPVVMYLNGTDRSVARLVAASIGSATVQEGVSLLGNLPDQLRRTYGDTPGMQGVINALERADRGNRGVFGRRSGDFNTFRRRFHIMSTAQSRVSVERAMAPISKKLHDILTEFKEATHGRDDEVLSMLLAMTVRARNEERAKQGLPLLFPNYVRAATRGEKGLRWEPVPIAEFMVNEGKYADYHDNLLLGLARSQKSGLLQKTELRDKLQELANEIPGFFDALGDLAMDAELLHTPLDSYLALITTPEGRELIYQLGKKDSGGDGKALTAMDSFRKERSTTFWDFRDKKGQYQWVDKWERDYFKDWTPQRVAEESKGDPDLAEKLQARVDTVKELEDMPEKPVPKNSDPVELNSRIRKGMFKTLTGSDERLDEFFETNPLAIMAGRLMAHERAMAKKWFTEWALSSGLALDGKVLTDLRNSESGRMQLANGAEVRIVPEKYQGIEGGGVRIGGRVFRRVRGISDDNPIRTLLGDSLDNHIFNEMLADQIERAGSLYEKKNVPNLLKWYDKALSIWRTATLFHPSWNINDFFGNINLVLSGDIQPDIYFKHLYKGIKAAFNEHDLEALKDMRFAVGDGREITGEEMFYNGVEDNWLHPNQLGELTSELMNRKIMSLGSTVDRMSMGIGEKLGEAAKTPYTASREFWRAYTSSHGLGGAFDAAGDKLIKNVIGPWFRVNHKMNQGMRIAAFASLIEQGYDVKTAANKIREIMYDYADLTTTESRYLRRIFGFYSWLRANSARQIQLLLERPGVAAMYPKLARAIEESINGDANVPPEQRPQWLRDQLALQIGRDPDNRFMLAMRNAIPAGDALELMAPVAGPQGLIDFAKYFFSNTNPILRAGPELATQHEAFTGRSIGADSTRGDVGLGEYATGTLRPLREFGVGSTREGPLQRSFGRGLGEGAARVLVGGRAQPFDEQRRVQGLEADFKKREDGLRSAIRRSERDKNHTQSLRRRVELLALYREMEKAGLDDAVPKWARKQAAVAQ